LNHVQQFKTKLTYQTEKLLFVSIQASKRSKQRQKVQIQVKLKNVGNQMSNNC
jgi:hypothetical protein